MVMHRPCMRCANSRRTVISGKEGKQNGEKADTICKGD